MSKFKLLIRWFPLISVLVFLCFGMILGFFYNTQALEGKAWTINAITVFSSSEKFNFFGSIAIAWMLLGVALFGRSTWPVSKLRALLLYFPVAFAFGFAARFFSMLFGFISFQSNTPDAVNLGNVSLITFFFVCVLVGLPTYFTFQDKIIKRKDMSDKTLRVICAFITIPMSLYIYHSYF